MFRAIGAVLDLGFVPICATPHLRLARYYSASLAIPVMLEVLYVCVGQRYDVLTTFRNAAYGLNKNQGQVITAQEIEKEADELRLACRDALCRSKERRKQFSDAVYALETEDTLPK